MTDPESDAAKMRQLVEAEHFVPGEGSLALADLVVSLRPWRDEQRVSSALRSWATRYSGEGSLDPGLADGAGAIAQHMRALGGLLEPLDDGSMLSITFAMLQNVARGRDPTEQDLLVDHVVGIPARTLRRYKQRARESGENPLHLFLVALQYDLDVAGLVRGGRSPGAARRWLQRHPGQHAKDASPPRRGPPSLGNP
jgi:hypothetical protein